MLLLGAQPNRGVSSGIPSSIEVDSDQRRVAEVPSGPPLIRAFQRIGTADHPAPERNRICPLDTGWLGFPRLVLEP